MHKLPAYWLLLCAAMTACTPSEPGDTTTATVSTSGPSSSSSSGAPTTGTGTPTSSTSADDTSGSASATGSTGNTSSTGPEVSSSTGESSTGSSTSTAGSSSSTASDSDDVGGETDTGVMVACDGVSSLDGVCIVFLPQPVAFSLAQAAAGISFDYVVIVTADVPDVTPQWESACDQTGPSGLYVRERVEGADQNYCVCDKGKCMVPKDQPTTLKQGEYPGSLEWDGKNWNGPSDTQNPKGLAFPAGMYTVKVSAIGKHQGQDFAVTAELPITLTP